LRARAALAAGALAAVALVPRAGAAGAQVVEPIEPVVVIAHRGASHDFPEHTLPAFTLEELRRLDFGSWFGPEFAGLRVVTLEEHPLHPSDQERHRQGRARLMLSSTVSRESVVPTSSSASARASRSRSPARA